MRFRRAQNTLLNQLLDGWPLSDAGGIKTAKRNGQVRGVAAQIRKITVLSTLTYHIVDYSKTESDKNL